MKTVRKIILWCLLAVCLLAVTGCGKKADENKPISEVKAEAEKMDVEKLRAMAMKYKDAIMAKKGEVEKFTGELKDIPLTEMLGEEAKQLKSEIEALNKSISALKERFQVYYDKLQEKEGDLSELEL